MIDRLCSLADVWWQTLTLLSVQLVVVVAVIGLLDRLLARGSWPQLQATLWLVVLVKLVLPPALSSPLSLARCWPQDAASPGGAGAHNPSVSVGCALWALGCVVLLIGSVHRYRRLCREWLDGTPLPPPDGFADQMRAAARQLRLARCPTVRIQRQVPGPAVLGFVHPIVVLPADLLRQAAPAQLRHVLLHEFAHVKRRDPLLRLVCLILQLVYWFHPLVWLCRRRLATLQELCCDQMVAAVLGPETADYRRTLLHLARSLLSAAPSGQLTFLAQRSQLLLRLACLEHPRPDQPWLRRGTSVLLLGGLVACVIPLARPVRPLPAPPVAVSEFPSLEGLQGCLQVRFAIHRLLAEDERQANLR